MKRYIITLFFVLAVLPLLAALTDITVQKNGADVVVSLVFDSEYNYNVVTSIEGVTGVVIDFDGMISLLPMDLFKIYRGGITEIEAVRFDDADFLRVIVNTDKKYPYEIEAEEGAVNIIFKDVNPEDFDEFFASSYQLIGGEEDNTVATEAETNNVDNNTPAEETQMTEEATTEENNVVEETTPTPEENEAQETVAEENSEPTQVEANETEEIELPTQTEETPVEKPAEKKVEKKVEKPKAMSILEKKFSKRISLELENADLLTVLRGLAETAGINIIASKNVKGTVTVHLKDVPWIDALDVILKSVGFTYRIDPTGIVRIATGEEFKKEDEIEEMAQEKVTRMYSLEFAKAKDISKVLKKQLTKGGYIEVDERTNSVIVSDIPKVHKMISQMISDLDVPTKQVEIVVKVVEIDASLMNELGIDWTVSNIGIGNQVVVTNAGIQSGPTQTGFVNVGTVPSYAQLMATLGMMEEQHKITTIANPRVTATNNTKAHILGGDKFTIRTVDANGNPVTQMYTVGTKLDVVPHINSMDEITLEISAEMSSVEGAQTNTPIIHTVEANTEQLVKDGETVVMGGFINKTEDKGSVGIPFISKIPVLGMLFGKQSKNVQKKEVLIFITPHIVKNTY